MGSLYLGMAGRVAPSVECAAGPWSYSYSLMRNCMLLGAKIEMVKMREGWVRGIVAVRFYMPTLSIPTCWKG